MRAALSSNCYLERGRRCSRPPALHSTSLSRHRLSRSLHSPPQSLPARLHTQPKLSLSPRPSNPPPQAVGRCRSFCPASWFSRSRSPTLRRRHRRRLDSGKAGSHVPHPPSAVCCPDGARQMPPIPADLLASVRSRQRCGPPTPVFVRKIATVSHQPALRSPQPNSVSCV